ncbi:MAG TPA: bifunctional lysylphosphatidylglycerol flippase/synthetase MprF [Thermoanaerobaculia bacterium]|nr:bifunctional lysylphosphatidylglycerol flippase/synthetase MprF [Thermoanaerobaculia bacterium]
MIRKLWPVAVSIIFLVALRVVYVELSHLRYTDLAAALDALAGQRIGLALLCTIGSYLAMTIGELLAVRYASSRVRYLRVSFASFIGSSFNNSVGFSGLLGGTLRYRLYTSWGLTAADVAKVIGFQAVTLWLGFFTLAGVVLIEYPLRAARALPFELATTRPLGIVFLAIPATYLMLTATRPIHAIRVRAWSFPLPKLRIAASQVVISTCDWLLLTTSLYLLIPPGEKHLAFGTVAAASLLAQVLGVASNLPGGVGVFDATVLTLLSGLARPVQLFAALIAFRIIYYLVPLSVAALLIIGYELSRNREIVGRFGRGAARVLPMFVPQIFAILVFLAGVVLLASGATPSERARIQFVRLAVPLPIVEASHLLASVTGVVLLLLARGLQRRINAAYVVALALLLAGAGFSLLKGLDYEEAMILFVTFAALLPCRRHFYRRATFLDEPFTRGWVVAIFLVISATVWLGFFSYRWVPYSTDLWWHFSFRGMGDASRFLRASVAAAVVALLFGLRNLLRPAPPRPAPAALEDIDLAQKIAHQSWSANGHLVLLADKSLLFTEDRSAFLMYGVEGRSWVAMGDPIGSDAGCRELAWRFLEEADRHDGWTVFYQVRQKNLPLYVDLGLTLLKLGEEARVPLENFTMEGAERKHLRKTMRRVEAEGVRFRVVPPVQIEPLLPQLRVVSDEWLAEKHTSEKRFSLGFFNEDYLKRLPLALVEDDRGIVAFADLWMDDHRAELTIDLMRHRSGAPEGVMDYLFIQLMQWAAGEGYRWFNLGMAPLSGLEARSIGPRWARLGAFGFRHGEYFYNFRGLRKYKEKFDPLWDPMYLACPGGFKLPVVLANIASLISGSTRGVVTKRTPPGALSRAPRTPEDDHSRSPSPA